MKIWVVVILVLTFVWIMTRLNSAEMFEGTGVCGDDGDCSMGKGLTKRSYYGRDDDYTSCYSSKQIYLNNVDDSATGHVEVILKKQFGKLMINLNCNLPYALGGVFHTMYGAYHAYIVNSRTNDNIYLGTLVRQGDRFYKLTTELLGDYRGYDQIIVTLKTEDFPPKTILSGSITKQNCSGGL